MGRQFTEIDETFICENCGKKVERAASGGGRIRSTVDSSNRRELTQEEKQAVVRDIKAILFASQITPEDIISDYKYKDEIEDIVSTLPNVTIAATTASTATKIPSFPCAPW